MSNIKQLNSTPEQWAKLIEDEAIFLSNLENKAIVSDIIVSLCKGTIIFGIAKGAGLPASLGLLASVLYREGHKAGIKAAEAKLSEVDKKLEDIH